MGPEIGLMMKSTLLLSTSNQTTFQHILKYAYYIQSIPFANTSLGFKSIGYSVMKSLSKSILGLQISRRLQRRWQISQWAFTQHNLSLRDILNHLHRLLAWDALYLECQTYADDRYTNCDTNKVLKVAFIVDLLNESTW